MGRPMNVDEYQKLAVRTAPTDYKPLTKQQMDLVHAVLGLTSELGELAGTIKAHIIYGKALDTDNLVEEQGDMDWYAALLCEAIGELRSVVLERNIAKLRKRYPNGYSDQAALARADKVVPIFDKDKVVAIVRARFASDCRATASDHGKSVTFRITKWPSATAKVLDDLDKAGYSVVVNHLDNLYDTLTVSVGDGR